jgi:biopolymer transport protein ExbD
MALKRQQNLMAAFSMASMTDVIFLLLIFFMVTSTYVFPTALEVNLPQSTQQTKIKPSIRIYLDAENQLKTVKGDGDAEPMTQTELATWLKLSMTEDPESFVALYADEAVSYGKIVEILNIGAELDIKIVLATTPTPKAEQPAAEADVVATDQTQATPQADTI